MQIKPSKTSLWLIAGAALVCSLSLKAQSLSLPFNLTQSSPAVSFGIDSYGTLLEKGPVSSSISFTGTTASQMIWMPAYSSFRAGYFTSTNVSLSSTGTDSAAFGYENTASGGTSAAFGSGSVASGNVSFVQGISSTASNLNSIAMGYSATASNSSAVAIGSYLLASGAESTALGTGTNATGMNSTAFGQGGTAVGQNSTAGGFATTANSYISFAIGTFNLGQSETGGVPNLTSWVATDPLFEVGNGTYSTHADALVVYKNGDAALHGKLRVAAGGDLSMGSFTSGTAP